MSCRARVRSPYTRAANRAVVCPPCRTLSSTLSDDRMARVRAGCGVSTAARVAPRALVVLGTHPGLVPAPNLRRAHKRATAVRLAPVTHAPS